jgi:hypothetical protein
VTIQERAVERRARAAAQAMVDAVAPYRPIIERAAAGLEPNMRAISMMRQAMERFVRSQRLLKLGHRLYEAFVRALESVPGGSCVIKALRALVAPVLYPDFRPRTPVGTAVATSTPSSRVTSPRRLVSHARSLRGPSAVLDIPHQPSGAALT